MADRLTQLQDCLDQLATQFYASIRYLSTHHPSSALPLSPPTGNPSQPADTAAAPDSNDAAAVVSFPAAQKELARDLLTKTRQIAYLISVLPGVETSEKSQEERIGALEREGREVEEERVRAVREMEAWRGRLERVIGGVRR